MEKVRRVLCDLAKSRRVRLISATVLAAFLLTNILLAVLYHDKTLPRTTLNGKSFSGVSYNQLNAELQKLRPLPAKITLVYKDTSASYKTSELGINVDPKKLVEQFKQQRSWLPIADIVGSRNIATPLKFDQGQFDAAYQKMVQTFQKQPTDAQIIFKDNKFVIQPESKGYQLQEARVKDQISQQIVLPKTRITLQPETLKPGVSQKKLKSDLEKLQKQQSTKVVFTFQSKSKKLTKLEIGYLYVQSGNTMRLSEQKMTELVNSIGEGFGMRVGNSGAAVSALRKALEKNQSLEFTLEQLIAKRTYTYCVAYRGVDVSNKGAFESKLASTYADKRGWSLDGQVSFVQATSGCNFTVWLAAANQVPGFGAICDSMWSCTASPNVVINYDRWAGTSPAWNAAGGSLDEYRSMVINHETGHWLGFGHRYCGGSGQAAPVMQQQSISLQGCKFNAWPNSGELTALRSTLGL